jgi:hypothetical protein
MSLPEISIHSLPSYFSLESSKEDTEDFSKDTLLEKALLSCKKIARHPNVKLPEGGSNKDFLSQEQLAQVEQRIKAPLSHLHIFYWHLKIQKHLMIR